MRAKLDFFAFFFIVKFWRNHTVICVSAWVRSCVHVCIYSVYVCMCDRVSVSHISFKQNSCKVPQRGHNGCLMEGVGKAEVRSWFLFIYMKACVSASSRDEPEALHKGNDSTVVCF